jgi:TorA maturation chaperone TorD
MSDMQAILAGLLNRDFATVEIAPYSMIEFARAVEARWPCPQATATRERLETWQRHDEDQERCRREYLSQRETEGVTRRNGA